MFCKRLGQAALVLLVVLLAASIAPWQLSSGVSKRSFDRIEVGMTEERVEAIIGFPEDKDGPRRLSPVTSPCFAESKGLPIEAWPEYRSRSGHRNQAREKVKWWNGHGICLRVAFDKQGQVLGCRFVTAISPESQPPE